MSEKICLATLKILLTPKEMKNIAGGSYTCWCFCDWGSFEATCPNDGSDCSTLQCPSIGCGPPVC